MLDVSELIFNPRKALFRLGPNIKSYTYCSAINAAFVSRRRVRDAYGRESCEQFLISAVISHGLLLESSTTPPAGDLEFVRSPFPAARICPLT